MSAPRRSSGHRAPVARPRAAVGGGATGGENGGKKKSIFSFDLSSLGKTRKAGKLDPPDTWTLRASLLPKSVIAVNRDRFIERILAIALVAVIGIALIVTLIMGVLVSNAERRTDDQRQLSLSLAQTKAKYNDVQTVIDQTNDIQLVRVGTLYAEINWPQVTDDLNKVLPSGASYTSLALSEYQINTGSASTGSSSGSSTGSTSIWGSTGVIAADFTVKSSSFISAKDFISNFKGLSGYLTGVVSSITGTDTDGYTYTGSVSIDLGTNTTDRSDNSGGVDNANRKLVETLRKSLKQAASSSASTSSTGE